MSRFSLTAQFLLLKRNRFVYQVVVPKALAPKDLLQVYESKERVVLPPWDPMVRYFLSPTGQVYSIKRLREHWLKVPLITPDSIDSSTAAATPMYTYVSDRMICGLNSMCLRFEQGVYILLLTLNNLSSHNGCLQNPASTREYEIRNVRNFASD